MLEKVLDVPTNTIGKREAERFADVCAQTLQADTAKARISLLITCWDWAKGQYHANDENPFHGLSTRFRSQEKKIKTPFSLAEVRAILDGFRSSRYYSHYADYAAFLLGIGCREAMRANFTGGDPQTIRKQTTKLIKIAKGKLSPASFDASPIDKDSGMLKYTESSLSEYLVAQEYSIATSYEYLVESTIAILYTSNKRIESLTIKRLETEKKLAQISEKEIPIDYLFCCPFCGSRKYIRQGKTPKSCGSPKCEDDYKIEWEQKNRPPTTTHDPEGWVMAFGGKRRSCTGIICKAEGGQFRQVNDKCLCRGCYVKTAILIMDVVLIFSRMQMAGSTILSSIIGLLNCLTSL
jgi:hypothetical protein